jgi:hypothetical protein
MDSTSYSTGVRGFLEWLEEQQPGIAKQVKQALPSKVPQAFANYHAGGYRTAGMSQDQALATSAAALGYLGDDTSTPDLTLMASDLSPVSTSDISAAASSVPQVDVTTAADSGATSTSVTDTIANLVKGISSLYLTKQQADIQQQVVNTQLQRAALGLPPLPQSIANLGVPQVSVGLSTGTGSLIAVGAGLFLLYLLFSRGRSRA